MKHTTQNPGPYSRAGLGHAPTAPALQAHRSPARKEARRSLVPSRPVLWFLFLFNLAVAVAAGAAGNHFDIHGHPVHGAQIAAGMGVVAAGAGIALLLRRGQRA